jgi:hypothetical protein
MATQSFSAVLERVPKAALWTILVVPFNVPEVLGERGNVRVRGTMNGQPFRCALRPRGGGQHYMMVNKAMRDAAGMAVGAAVDVVLELDTKERPADVPPDLAVVLNGNAAAAAAFAKLSPSHRFEFVSWLEETQNPDMRQKRLSRTVEMLAARTSPRGPSNRGRGG